MQKKWVKILSNGILISLLAHLLLFTSFMLIWMNPSIKQEDEKKPGLYIPAYMYQQQSNTPVAKVNSQKNNAAQKTMSTAITSAEKKVSEQAIQSGPEIKTIKQMKVMNLSKAEEPLHLIGDKKVDKPLLVLLGKALTHHLLYPKIAWDFRVRGMVLIGFLLHPNGQLTDVQIVRTSGAGVLDDAALAATQAISPVKKVDQYLTGPKFLVVGIIFG